MKTSNPRKSRAKAIPLFMAAGLVLVAGCGKSDKEEGAIVSVQAAPAQKSEISRVVAAEEEWQERADAALAEQIDSELLATLRAEATERLDELESVIADIEERMRVATGDRVELPTIEVPAPEIDEDAARQALVAFDDDWVTATRALIARKQYGIGGGA